MALMMAAQYQQVAAAGLHLLQHHFRGFAAEHAQLGAGRGELGQAAIQCLARFFMLLAALAGVQYMEDGQAGVVLAGQLGCAAQRHVGGVAQVMGDENVIEHGDGSPAAVSYTHLRCV